MRIGIDARELGGKPTGVGRYLGGLLREWSSTGAAHGHELLLYTPRPLDGQPTRLDVRVIPGTGGTLWEQRDLRSAVASDRVDVLFSPAYSTPLLSTVPRVVALHDVSFAARPEWFARREGLRRRIIARRSARAARAIVTISEFSRGEIARTMKVATSKVHVIPPGIDSPCAAAQRADDATGADALFVGSIFNRRHVPELLAAFAQVVSRHPDARLHLVGDNRTYPRHDIGALISTSGCAEQIRWYDYVSDERLRELYSRARAFVFLSEYEGLGLTPLEALSCGIPSLLLDTPVARESCGRAASYVGLGSTGNIAAALETLLYDASARASLLAHAPDALARYRWPQAADATLRVLEGAV